MQEDLKYLLLIGVQVLTFYVTPLICIVHIFSLLYLTDKGYTQGRLAAAYITSGVGCLLFSMNCLLYWSLSAALSWGICCWLRDRKAEAEVEVLEHMPEEVRQDTRQPEIHKVSGDIYIDKAIFIKDYPQR